MSKSRLIAALQCERRLWLAVNHPEAETVDALRDSVFATGHEVGEMARRLAQAEWGVGELIDVRDPGGWPAGLQRCQDALATPGPLVLFEAPFAHDGLAVLCDIVVRTPASANAPQLLHLVEVKSSTAVAGRPYAEDAAIQAWCMARCGHAPDRVSIRVLNRRFVYAGDGDYRGLFRDEDVTEQVRALMPKVPQWLARGRAAAAGAEPAIRTGAHCHKPYACGYLPYCRRWEAALYGPPPEHPVGLLGSRNTGRLTRPEREHIAQRGWVDLRELPDGFPADPRGRIIVQAARTGIPWRDPALRDALQALPWPRCYFDFETMAFAIPRWAGTRPYDAVPFQWSCHVEHRDGRIQHHDFLDLSGDDPREPCAASLLRLLDQPGDAGAVVVYHQPFESAQLSALAQHLPHHAAGLQRVRARLHDLLPIVRQHYYHPAQHGSYSIKAVLPTVAPELDYAELDEVQHGLGAQLAYQEATAAHTSPERREHLRERLRAYCRHDTEAMRVLVQRLGGGGNTR